MGAWGSLGDEFTRLKNDPFAILGIVVIIVGVILAYYGIKRLIKGKSE
jgi:Na+/H+ antiporter NhaC